MQRREAMNTMTMTGAPGLAGLSGIFAFASGKRFEHAQKWN
jgi:hypothetical protein